MFMNDKFRVYGNKNDRGLLESILPACPFEWLRKTSPHRWCLHLIVVVEFECSSDPESYTGGGVATGRATHAEQVKG
jgi:hypothetical protein